MAEFLNRRVVVTGMGAVTPIGIGVPAFAEALQAGRSGRAPIHSFDATGFPVKEACEIKGFDPKKYHVHILDPFIQYAVAATGEAIADSGIDFEAQDPYRIGASISTSKGGMHTVERFGDRFAKSHSAILGARIYSNSVPNFAAQWVARRWKLKGPAKCYVAACATGTVAISEGARMVSEGIVDFCLAGSSDGAIVPLILAGYKNMKVLSPGAIRPFDNRRNGFVAGEGSGILFLEDYEHARRRNAPIYGEVLGWSQAVDATHPLHFSDKEAALARAIRMLFERTGIAPEQMDYMNLHGTGTRQGDIYETEQIKKALGADALKIPMSSTKSMTGHMLGAAGAAEAIACILAMQKNFLPPTIGLEEKDPACDLDYVPCEARQAKVERTASLSLGFGGHIATLAFGKV